MDLKLNLGRIYIYNHQFKRNTVDMILELEEIEEFFEEPYLSRGRDYFGEGLITSISMTPKIFKAKASGSRVYDVAITKNKDLDGFCSCPAFENLGPCKHMAALIHAIFAKKNGGYKPSLKCTHEVECFEDFVKLLKRKTKAELIEMLLQLSDHYPEIIDELIEEEG